jgi:hypothetical protein
LAAALQRSRKYRATAAGNSPTVAAANGAPRAEPLAIKAQRSTVPTTVRDAAPAWAQPLPQPEMWSVDPSPRYGAAAATMRGAKARAAI